MAETGAMGPSETEPEFYREVDRYRYRTKWPCLFWALVFVLVVTGGIFLWLGIR